MSAHRQPVGDRTSAEKPTVDVLTGAGPSEQPGGSVGADDRRAMSRNFAWPVADRAVQMFGWLAVERVVRLGLAFVVGAAVARHLAPADFGLLSAALALAGLFGFLGSAGLELIVKREFVEHPERIGETASSALVIRLCGACLGVVLTWLAVLGISDEPILRRAGLLAAVASFPACATIIEWSLQSQRRGRPIAIALFAGTLASALYRIVLITLDGPLLAFAAAPVVDAAVVSCALAVASRREPLMLSLGSATSATSRRLLRECWPLLVAAAAVSLYLRMDQVMLTIWRPSTEVGAYAAAVRLAELPQFAAALLATARFTDLVEARRAGEASFREASTGFFSINVAFGLAAAFALAPFAEAWVRLVFGPGFEAGATPLRVLAFANVWVFLGVARSQVLSVAGVSRFLAWASLGGAGANLFLNFMFIPRWGATGAASATLISFAIAAWLTSFALPGRHRWLGAAQARGLLLRGVLHRARRS